MNEHKRIVSLVVLIALLLFGFIATWRLFRVPQVAQTQLLPESPVALIQVEHLNRLIDAAKASPFLQQALQTPLVRQFMNGPTWRGWLDQKRQLELKLQTRLDERAIRETIGRRVTWALYPDSHVLMMSIISPGARLQALWNEWTDLFHTRYAIQRTRYQGTRFAILHSQEGTFYYALFGRFGMLSSDRLLLQRALERYRNRSKRPPFQGIQTYLDVTRAPDTLPYRTQLHAAGVRDWRSRTYLIRGRLVSEHRFTFKAPLGFSPPVSSAVPGRTLPSDIAIGGFLRVPPEFLWRILRPSVQIQGEMPSLRPYMLPGLEFAIQSTKSLLPAVALLFPVQKIPELTDALQSLHGRVLLGRKPIKVGAVSSHADAPFYPLSWSPAPLLKFRGGYAVTLDRLSVSNNVTLLKTTLETLGQRLPPLEHLFDLADQDGAIWIQPTRFGELIQQLTQLSGVATVLTGTSLPWLKTLSQSTAPLQELEGMRVSVDVEPSALSLRMEILAKRIH